MVLVEVVKPVDDLSEPELGISTKDNLINPLVYHHPLASKVRGIVALSASHVLLVLCDVFEVVKSSLLLHLIEIEGVVSEIDLVLQLLVQEVDVYVSD